MPRRTRFRVRDGDAWLVIRAGRVIATATTAKAARNRADRYHRGDYLIVRHRRRAEGFARRGGHWAPWPKQRAAAW